MHIVPEIKSFSLLSLSLYLSLIVNHDGLNSTYSKGVNDKNLLVFFYITSSLTHVELRNAIRTTWLQSCIQSMDCDYAFFIDQSLYNKSSSSSTSLLQDQQQYHEEYQLHQDIVYRDSCELMKRHPSYINYGNSPPNKDNLERQIIDEHTRNVTQIISLPDYPFRRLYKIDWKMCFLKHVYNKIDGVVADYHVFVEDDSYVCTNHLIFQLGNIKKRLNSRYNNDNNNNASNNAIIDNDRISDHADAHDHHQSFRVGTPMYDGFDDSSTIMTKDIAMLFMEHYPIPPLTCDNHIEQAKSINDFMFLSWGNSWSKHNCNWSKLIFDLSHIDVNYPLLNCNQAHRNIMAAEGHYYHHHQQQQLQQQHQNQGDGRESFNEQNSKRIRQLNTNHSMCYPHPLIFHHPHADIVILGDDYMKLYYANPHHDNAHDINYYNINNSISREEYYKNHKNRNYCDNMLLIDNIKDPITMSILSELEKHGDQKYRDFSPIFLSRGYDGWHEVLTNPYPADRVNVPL